MQCGIIARRAFPARAPDAPQAPVGDGFMLPVRWGQGRIAGQSALHFGGAARPVSESASTQSAGEPG